MTRIAYTPVEPTGVLMPFLALRLRSNSDVLNATGLVDSGASMNVLPFDLGLMLGGIWEQQTVSLTLSGTLAHVEARAVIFDIIVPSVSEVPIKQAFAWTRSKSSPLILGQVNFFMALDVCFHRSQSYFVVSLPTS